MSTNPQQILKIPSAAFIASGDTLALNHGNPLPVDGIEQLWIDIDVTATSGTNTPTLIPSWERLGEDGIYYPVWTGTGITGTGQTSIDIGPGLTIAMSPGLQGKLAWAITGTTPSFTFSASIQGK